MLDFHSAPSVVVGVDGSPAATRAAIWAVDEAVSRDIPLRLVYVIDPAELSDAADHANADHAQFVSGRTALHTAQRAVEATGESVKVETEIVYGRPLAKLRVESRSAAMVCVGSIGMKHACHGIASVAALLAGSAQCPVAVIRSPLRRRVTTEVGNIVVEADDVVVLRHAFEEARLRGAPLRVVSSWRAEAREDFADAHRLAQAQVNRRITRWRREYPDVQVQPVVLRGSVYRYLATYAESIQLFISGPLVRSGELGNPDNLACSVLTVRHNYL